MVTLTVEEDPKGVATEGTAGATMRGGATLLERTTKQAREVVEEREFSPITQTGVIGSSPTQLRRTRRAGESIFMRGSLATKAEAEGFVSGMFVGMPLRASKAVAPIENWPRGRTGMRARTSAEEEAEEETLVRTTRTG
jgi:hypothetical protein